MLTQLSEWARLGFIRRTGTGTYALDTPPPNWPPDYLADQLTDRSPGVVTDLDSGEERGKVPRPQRSNNEQPCTGTSAIHTHHTPRSDTPTTSWT
ncbi:MAG: hypothetical protein M3460_29410 [Actinomycetota bacterium]|nr:hypothetical protein [Actinomycetota bacterium]